MFRIPKDTEMTPQLLDEFIAKHKQEVTQRYDGLYRAYISDHDILHREKNQNTSRITVSS